MGFNPCFTNHHRPAILLQVEFDFRCPKWDSLFVGTIATVRPSLREQVSEGLFIAMNGTL
jgi:hypothetical protein